MPPDVKTKRHKAMPDSEWRLRMKKFAETGKWPSELGNKPSIRQPKWNEQYLKIQQCPLTKIAGGLTVLTIGPTKCSCNYHIEQKKTVIKPEQTSPKSPKGSSKVTKKTDSPQKPPKISDKDTIPTKNKRSTPSPKKKTPLKVRLPRSPRLSASPDKLQSHEIFKLGVGSSQPSTVDVPPSKAQTQLSTRAVSRPSDDTQDLAAGEPKSVDKKHKIGPSKAKIQTAALHSALTISAVEEKTEDVFLPPGWRKTIPSREHRWISRALFSLNQKNQYELIQNLKLWYEPPQPPLLCNQPPSVSAYYHAPLFVWMPYKMWQVKFFCPNPPCNKFHLVGGGISKKARQVLDIDHFYTMVGETLICQKCRKTFISWHPILMEQLDIGHRNVFQVIVTKRFACDMKVVRMLRERGIGNSCSRLSKQLKEQHSEAWVLRSVRYLTECEQFLGKPGTSFLQFKQLPVPSAVPTYKWLLTIHCQDIIQRLDDIKAKITSTYGRVLKMDSTKKITKKLAGVAAGTALWASSVGNEIGQVLNTVLTAQEGTGLKLMSQGLIKRYAGAGVDPPQVLYVDRDCCALNGVGQAKATFSAWPNLITCLDIWHFMRRIAAGVTTDAHQLYGTFMARLSDCIFEWDASDLAQLKAAKRGQLRLEGIANPSDQLVSKRIGRSELALHCRRKTRGVKVTNESLYKLLTEFASARGRDALGVELLDSSRIWRIWENQQRHIKCIQDPPNVDLYTRTGAMIKGGVELATYRCSRGSTSLESYHLHLNRFIPGTSANAVNFQAYLIEGLSRWNEDRAAEAVQDASSTIRCYGGSLVHTLNTLSEKVFGKKEVEGFRLPGKYTGEAIGVEYLFRQTDRAIKEMLEDCDDDTDAETKTDDDTGTDELDEGFIEMEAIEVDDQTIAELLPIIDAAENTSQTSAPRLPKKDIRGGKKSKKISPQSEPVDKDELPEVATETAAENAGAEIQTTTSVVDRDHIPGFEKVDRLVTFLESFKDEIGLSLRDDQADLLIALWDDLYDYDKAKTTYSPRNYDRAKPGRYKVSSRKTTEIAPGVESVKRLILNDSGRPAQWPDCNRVVEGLCLKLVSATRSPRKLPENENRWSLVLNQYENIRRIVNNNGKVMENTTIQLVSLSEMSLRKWHSKRAKQEELVILQQGLNLQPARPTSSQPLPAAREQPESRPIYLHEPHQYDMPENRSGQSKIKRPKQRKTPPSCTINAPKCIASAPPCSVNAPPCTVSRPLSTANESLGDFNAPQYMANPQMNTVNAMPYNVSSQPFPIQPVQLFPQTPGFSFVTVPSNYFSSAQFAVPTIPDSVDSLQGRKRAKYQRKAEYNKCRKCGDARTSETGHSQYKGRIFCPKKETLAKAEWLRQQRENDEKR